MEDPSYVAYIKAYKGRLRLCKMYTECRVIPIPQIVSKNFGGGWILPKNRDTLFNGLRESCGIEYTFLRLDFAEANLKVLVAQQNLSTI